MEQFLCFCFKRFYVVTSHICIIIMLAVFKLELLFISKVRILGAKAGISKISRIMNHIRFEFGKTLPDIGQLFNTGESILRQIYFEPKEKNIINLNILNDELQYILLDIEAFLRLLIDEASNDNL